MWIRGVRPPGFCRQSAFYREKSHILPLCPVLVHGNLGGLAFCCRRGHETKKTSGPGTNRPDAEGWLRRRYRRTRCRETNRNDQEQGAPSHPSQVPSLKHDFTAAIIARNVPSVKTFLGSATHLGRARLPLEQLFPSVVATSVAFAAPEPLESLLRVPNEKRSPVFGENHGRSASEYSLLVSQIINAPKRKTAWGPGFGIWSLAIGHSAPPTMRATSSSTMLSSSFL